MSNIEQAADDDIIIGKLNDLYGEAESEYKSFQAKIKAATGIDPLVKSALKNLFSMLTDTIQITLQAHSETFVWASGVDNDIEELKGEEATTQFLPEDALRLKSLLLALSQNLRSASGADDDVPEVLGKQIAESILFIDEHTLELDEDDEEDDKSTPGDSEGDDDEGEQERE